jgi:hypothetical protein
VPPLLMPPVKLVKFVTIMPDVECTAMLPLLVTPPAKVAAST